MTTVRTNDTGAGIWSDESSDLLLSTNWDGGLHVFNVSDPARPHLAGRALHTLDREASVRDVDLMEHSGRDLAIVSDEPEGIQIVDVTDPTDPQHVATADEYTSHNLAVVDGTPYVYNAGGKAGPTALLDDPFVPVLDLSVPEEPTSRKMPIPATVAGEPSTQQICHDVSVRSDLGMAYCAAGTETYLWNISRSPLDPEWVGVVKNPAIVYHHQAIAGEDGNLLFINDEVLAPNCQRASAGPVTVEQSTAAVWIYNITDPSSPRLLSYVQADSPDSPIPEAPNCGSHFGDVVAGGDAIVWGWYQGGTILVDVSDPGNPTLLDQEAPDGSTWGARYHDGHVYASGDDLHVYELR